MNILIISQYYYPEQFMITNIAEKLFHNGHKVTVLTGVPNYPMGKLYEGYKNRFQKESINSIEVIRVPLILRGSGLKMILNYFSFAILGSIKTLFLKKKFDLIYVFEVSPITQIYPARVYKFFKNKKAKICVNCQDIWPEVLKSNGFNEKSIIFKIGFHISDTLYNKADQILISSKLFESYLHENFKINRSKIRYLPNYADDWVLNVKYKSNEKTHFLFAGNLGKAQNLNIILEAAAKTKKKEKLIIDFVGDGSEFFHLKNLAKKYELEDIVFFHGRKSGLELKEFYDNADAFLLTLTCDNKICYTVPSKLQGYMGSGKPIIASILGGAKELIEEAKCGVVSTYNDAQALAKVFDDFIVSRGKYQMLGINGRNYFINYFREEIYIKNLIDFMEEITHDNF